MPRLAQTMKRLYCLWNFKQCAIYKVSSVLPKAAIPEDLFPADTTRAKIILAQNYHIQDQF
jgi:hypothetical protein